MKIIHFIKNITLAFILAFGMLACSHTESDSVNDQPKTSDINIEDITWNVDEGILDGDRYVLMSYTNNSPYVIASFEISFTEKESMTEEEKNNFYSNIQENFELSNEDMDTLKKQKISIHTECEMMTEPGQSVSNVYCYYYQGYYYLKDIQHFQFVEPDIATIRYLNNNQIITTYYDFHSKKYSKESSIEIAYQWPNSDFVNQFPKLETKILEPGLENEDSFTFDAYGITLDQFNAYVDTCKSQGFTNDLAQHEGFYSAQNDQGYSIYLSYDDSDQSIYGSFKSPKESTES